MPGAIFSIPVNFAPRPPQRKCLCPHNFRVVHHTCETAAGAKSSEGGSAHGGPHPRYTFSPALEAAFTVSHRSGVYIK